MSSKRTWLDRMKVLLLAGFVLGAVAACDGSLLDVDDPDNVQQVEELEPGNVSPRLNGMVNDFRNMMDFYVLYTGLLTDEFLLAGTFPTRLQVDDRAPLVDNVSINADVWQPMSVSRATADALVREFEANIDDPDFAASQGDMQSGIAFGKLFGGYDRLFFAEFFCQSIFGGQNDFPQVNVGEAESAPVLPAARAQEAITLLEAAEADAVDFGNESVRQAALIGQARAHMFLGSLTGDPSHFTTAAGLVEDIDTEFMLAVEYDPATPGEENEVFQQTWDINTGGLRWTVGAGNDPNRGFEAFAPGGRDTVVRDSLGNFVRRAGPGYTEWITQGLLLSQELSASPDGADKSAFNGSSPISIQTYYAGRDGTLSGQDIPLATGWEARMIEAEARLRGVHPSGGGPAAAESDVNDLLTDDQQLLNPIVQVTPSLADPAAPSDITQDSLTAFDPVSFDGVAQGVEDFSGTALQANLIELARAAEAGLWMTGHRQHVLRRFAAEFNDRSALGLYPEDDPDVTGDEQKGTAITLPIPAAEVDNNTNIDQSCPAGFP